jgi:outer membrane immunogenic protein
MKKLYAAILGLTLTSAATLSANAADVYGGGYKGGPVYAVVDNWSGFYAGANAGYGWTANSGGGDLSPSGGYGGGQIGYNWQGVFGLGPQWVLGVEADIQGSGISDSASFGNGGSIENSLNWFGTVRGRIGYAMGPALFYFTGGFAFGEVESKGRFGNMGGGVGAGAPFDFTDTQTGYVLGGGVEYKFNPAWSVKGEYQFISLDANDATGPLSGGATDRSEVHTLRVGVNYHLGQGYDPLLK